MVDQIQHLLDRYAHWLKDNTVLRDVDGWIEITTPFLDRHNDCIRIYVKRDERGFLLTDGGEVIEDLKLSGCVLDSEKRQALLNMTLNGFGVQLHEQAIEAHASESDFAQRKHNLVQAMLAVNDLFYLSEPVVASLFLEDVTAWLSASEIRCLPRVKFTGLSGLDHYFDFAIPRSRKEPERLLWAINHPTKNRAELMAFAWIDTKGVREPNSRAYALLNDNEIRVRHDVIDALGAYEIQPVLWSKRASVLQELVA